mmetsp:Transcript_2218/g.5258  ORF Transcript_2218/g.5258 Transcript_2218/m.5258 type:complete len:114 (+) Transcript_2218:939-1280(+)
MVVLARTPRSRNTQETRKARKVVSSRETYSKTAAAMRLGRKDRMKSAGSVCRPKEGAHEGESEEKEEKEETKEKEESELKVEKGEREVLHLHLLQTVMRLRLLQQVNSIASVR